MSFVITLLLALDIMCGGQVDCVLKRLGLGHRFDELAWAESGLKDNSTWSWRLLHPRVGVR